MAAFSFGGGLMLDPMAEVQAAGEAGKKRGLQALMGQAYNANPAGRQSALARIAGHDPQMAMQAQKSFDSQDGDVNKMMAQRAKQVVAWWKVNPTMAQQAYASGLLPVSQRAGIQAPPTLDESMIAGLTQLASVGDDDGTPMGFRELDMKARAAGYTPGTPEYQRAMQVGIGMQGRAASGGFSFEMIEGADGKKRPGRRNPRDGSVEVFDETVGDFVPMGGGSSLNGGGFSPPPQPQASISPPQQSRGGVMDEAYLDSVVDSLVGPVEQQESGGNVNAVSPKGAAGPMQIMPATGRDPGFGVAPLRDGSPEENRRFGRDYLKAMLRKFDGNVELALAAYNGGPARMDNSLASAGGNPAAAIGRMPQESREYVPGVLNRTGAQQRPSGNPSLAVGRSPEEQAGLTTAAQEQAKIDAELRNYDEMTRKEAERAGLVAGATKTGAMAAERTGEAQAIYPKIQAQAESMKSVIDKALHHPGRAIVTGGSGVFQAHRIPGTDAKDFMVLQNQIKGKAFLEAFQGLKGGGAITEREGEAATAAMARLDTAQSDQEYVAALKELRTLTVRGEARARFLAGRANRQQKGGSDIDSILDKYR